MYEHNLNRIAHKPLTRGSDHAPNQRAEHKRDARPEQSGRQGSC